jgi:hypothetical protein
MKQDYGIVLCEQMMFELDNASATGAGIGAGIGAAKVAIQWVGKRYRLSKEMAGCMLIKDPKKSKECRAEIYERIDTLNKQMLKKGIFNTLIGAGLGVIATNVMGAIKEYNSIDAAILRNNKIADQYNGEWNPITKLKLSKEADALVAQANASRDKFQSLISKAAGALGLTALVDIIKGIFSFRDKEV